MLEFIAGIIVASACLYAYKILVNAALRDSSQSRLRVRLRQSNSVQYRILAGVLDYTSYQPGDPRSLKTQATDFHDKMALKILILEDSAYWIEHNKLYQADVVRGQMDPSSTKVIDTMVLDGVELEKIIFVVDKLTGRYNDEGRDSGQ